MNKTCKSESKPIDSSGIIEYVEGCEVINYNDIIETYYRAYMIDINIDEYFKEEVSV